MCPTFGLRHIVIGGPSADKTYRRQSLLPPFLGSLEKKYRPVPLSPTARTRAYVDRGIQEHPEGVVIRKRFAYFDFIVLVTGLSPSDSAVRTIEETNYSMGMQILFDRGG